MTTLAQLAPEHVVGCLRAYGFRIDAQNQTCSHLADAMRTFVATFCSAYDAEIDAELMRDRSARRADLISWANSEIVRIMHSALDRYSAEIVRHAAIEIGPNRIECQEGLKEFRLFVDFVERSKNQADIDRRHMPNSRRIQIKRKNRTWEPYGIAIAWDTLKELARRVAGR